MEKRHFFFQNRQSRYIPIIAMIVIVLVGCTSGTIPNITPTPCEEFVSKISYPSTENRAFILIEYEMVRKTEEIASEAKAAISSLLPLLVEPNDKLVIIPYEKNSILFNETVPSFELPDLLPLPTDPNLIPTLTPAPTRSSAINNQYETIATQIGKNNFERNNSYNCSAIETERQNQKKIDDQKEIYKQERGKFISQSLSSISKSNDYSDSIRTYEMLSYASSILQDRAVQQSDYSERYLILFSDMLEFRDRKPDQYSIDFSGVKVILVLNQCDFSFNCDDIESRWINELNSFGASDVIPIYAEQDFQSAIENSLSRR